MSAKEIIEITHNAICAIFDNSTSLDELEEHLATFMVIAVASYFEGDDASRINKIAHIAELAMCCVPDSPCQSIRDGFREKLSNRSRN